MEQDFTLMRKGLSELRKTSSPKRPNVGWNYPDHDKIHPSKAFHAVKKYYEKQAEEQKKSSSISNSVPYSEELQKCFLKRPGCPQYCHRTTSTSFLVYPSSSESIPRLPKWKSFTEGFPPHSQLKNRSGNKIPWYIPVLHEKDLSLNKMGEELARLSPFEAECIRKEGVIAVLLEEVQTMQKQLDQLQKQQAAIPEKSPDEKRAEEETWAKGDVTKLLTLGVCPSIRRGRKSFPFLRLEQVDLSEQLLPVEHLNPELSQSEQTLDSKALLLNMELLKDQEELEQLEKEAELMNTEEETFSSSESKVGELESGDLEESENTLILYKLLEFQKVNEMLYEEVQRMQNEHDLATGTISSLQRQLSFEESQIRKAHTDHELLQKELRERGEQLEAMSNKFCNLREERKHEEMMGSIERENYKLRQELSRLEVQLADKGQLVSDLQSNISQLQSELLANQHRTGKQLSSQNELQRQLEILQRVEQQTRVTLESISARFERFRSKIIQATYSTPGTKSPQAEITDDEVLEALQKIITDRLDFHQLLKQKGVKVPSLSSEPAPPPTHKKKTGK
ncbi:coiled-coil domain-containing protein 27 isoform 3-T8 [Liasis olivaceus]